MPRPSLICNSSTNSAPTNKPLAQERVASVMCASGNSLRNSRNAGRVIIASPTQLVPLTMMRLTLVTWSSFIALLTASCAVLPRFLFEVASRAVRESLLNPKHNELEHWAAMVLHQRFPVPIQSVCRLFRLVLAISSYFVRHHRDYTD